MSHQNPPGLVPGKLDPALARIRARFSHELFTFQEEGGTLPNAVDVIWQNACVLILDDKATREKDGSQHVLEKI